MTVRSTVNGNRASLRNVDVLKYPLDLDNVAMVINVLNYNYRSNEYDTDASTSNVRTSGGGNVVRGSIALPLPSSLTDTTTPDLGPMQLGLTGKTAAELAAAGTSLTPSEMGAMAAKFLTADPNAVYATGKAANMSIDDLKNYTLLAARYGLTSLSPEIAGGIGIGTGTAVNPHNALAFNGVNMKSYDFHWTMSPKNIAETESIRKIIKALRRAALPEYQSVTILDPTLDQSETIQRALLNYPSMVKISWFGLDPEHFPKIKTGMITQVSADYAPQGHIVLNRGDVASRPGMIALTISVMEAQIHTKADYGDE